MLRQVGLIVCLRGETSVEAKHNEIHQPVLGVSLPVFGGFSDPQTESCSSTSIRPTRLHPGSQ